MRDKQKPPDAAAQLVELKRQLAAALAENAALAMRLARYRLPAVAARRRRAEFRNLAVHVLIVERGLPWATLADWRALLKRLDTEDPTLTIRDSRKAQPDHPFDPAWKRKITPQGLRRSYLAWRSQLQLPGDPAAG